jgi:signal transduction histidine kinase
VQDSPDQPGESRLLADENQSRLFLTDAQQLALARSLSDALEMVCRSAHRQTGAQWAAAWVARDGQVLDRALYGIERLPADLVSRVGGSGVLGAQAWNDSPREGTLICAPIVYGERIIGGIAIRMPPGRREPGAVRAHMPTRSDSQRDRQTGLLLEFLAALCAVGFGHRHQLDQQQQRAGRAENARREQADFLSMVSHDVRSPLSAIDGYAQMLLNSPDSFTEDTRAAALGTIINQVRRINTLVNGLLDMARSENGTLRLNLQRMDLREVVSAAMQLADTDGRYRVELPSEPVMCAVDPVRIEQVIANLVGNALKYGAAPWRLVLYPATDRYWRMELRDAGPGLDPQIENHLFQRFVPGARSVGLGLSIVQAMTIAHGGRVRYRRDGDTTVFEIAVPVDPGM